MKSNLRQAAPSQRVRPKSMHCRLRPAMTAHLCLRQTFTPLVEKCKRLNRAMRIGTNHGSLSARILSYYGDTPRGMVESAFEFADICRCYPYLSSIICAIWRL